jgi:hypothetical protein
VIDDDIGSPDRLDFTAAEAGSTSSNGSLLAAKTVGSVVVCSDDVAACVPAGVTRLLGTSAFRHVRLAGPPQPTPIFGRIASERAPRERPWGSHALRSSATSGRRGYVIRTSGVAAGGR